MSIYKIILGVAAILSVGNLFITKVSRLLSVFLILITILEIFIANYFVSKYENNHIVYTFISYLSVLFYLIYFRIKADDSKKMNRVYITLFVLWHLFAIWNFIWGDGMSNINIKTYNLGMIISSFLVLYWFYKKLYIDDFELLFSNPKLYIGFGILIFYTCSFTILNFIDYFITGNHALIIYSDLLKIGNIFLSLGYFCAILCSIKKTLYTTS